MPVYEWKRRVPAAKVQKNLRVKWEYTLTDTTDPPEGEGWVRVYSLSIGSVRGAGGSPSRKVNTRGSD